MKKGHSVVFVLLAVLGFFVGFSAFADPLVDPYSLFLIGEVKTTSPDGKWLSSSVSLIKRTAIPLESRIEIRSLDLQKDTSVTERTTLMNVTGSNYVVTDKEGSYSGTGAWIGEPWRWTNWRYQVTFPKEHGGLEGEDHLDAHTLKMRKRYFDNKGKTVSRVSADFTMISEKAYELLAAKIDPSLRAGHAVVGK